MQRSRSYTRRGAPIKPKVNFKKLFLKLFLLALLIVVAFLTISYHFNHRYDDSPNIKLGSSGYCLDDYQDKLSSSSLVEAWHCNSSKAQIWSVSGINIIHANNYCLGVANNSQSTDAKVVLSPCDGSAGQVWLRVQNGYQNPNSTLCLTASSNPNKSLSVQACNNSSNQTWSPVASISSSKILTSSCAGDEGALVACYAEKEYTTWQSGTISHENLLNTYTDGAPNEEWCADFISYVYKEAGFPFTQGSANGWDENNANYVQYMGFNLHMASSGYVPKPGDVAFFDYPGGHVEIVIAGGSHPTFIYGDSATIDPTTGNGQMKANTIIGDQDGQVVYYLSPN